MSTHEPNRRRARGRAIQRLDKTLRQVIDAALRCGFIMSKMRYIVGFLAVFLCATGVATTGTVATAVTSADGKGVGPNTTPDDARMRAAGRYLVEAGDCRSCHTRPGGQPFAGGLAIRTPFGTVYTPNLTPDRETGIGTWSDNDFYRALHRGRSPQDKPYYPVFPYTFFTKITKSDVLAIKAYLFSLKPVHYKRPRDQMSWPYGYRPLLDIWQDLFFQEGVFQPDPKRSPVYNRGAYLVDGLGHCGACHTPRNFLGATEPGMALTGAHISGWFAPNISSDLKSTIRDMSVSDVVHFLQTGASNPEASGFGPGTAALGPMAEVVHRSLSHLTDADLTAIATYLKESPTPADAEQGAKEAHARPLANGAKIYAANCSACHGRGGDGTPPYFPALKGNTVVNLADPTDVVHTVIHGAPQYPDQRYSPYATMPAFGGQLSDKEIAAVTTYIRSHWGNNAPPVKPAAVKALR